MSLHNSVKENRILVVEDEMITAMDIKNRLQEMGYIVPATASSGEEAISLAEKLTPDLILMDIVLKSEIDGTQAAQYIANKFHIPIIFLTAYNDENTFNRAKLSSPFGYINKPFNEKDLKIALELAFFKHAEEMKLIAAEKRNRLLMENATCGLFTFDKNGNILDVNKQAEVIFGRQKNDIIGNDFRSLIPSDERDYATILLNKILNEKTVSSSNSYIQTPSGHIKNIEISGACVDIDNDLLLMCVINDVTETIRLREKSLLNDKLSILLKLSDEIISDINAPLTMVLASSHYLKAKIDGLENNTINPELLTKVKLTTNQLFDEANKIHEIIKDLQEFSSNDESQLSLVNIHDVLDAVIHIIQLQFKISEKFIKKNYTSKAPELLFINSKLQQVFLILMTNAIQSFLSYDKNHDAIQLSTFIEKNNIVIEMVDASRSIPAEILPHIFEPFFITKPSSISAWLGLPICYEIINNMGGQIQVKNKLGEGTVFTVCLPMHITMQDQHAENKSTTKKPKRIWVIADNATLLSSIEHVLSQQHHYTSTVLGGRNALKLLKQNAQFDLIICDLDMSDVNGMDLYLYISQHLSNAGKQMIFLAESANSLANSFGDKIQIPCIEKPFTAKQLLDAIDQIDFK